MQNNYIYAPEEYSEVLNLYEEMKEFYTLLEDYRKKKTIRSRLFLEKQLNDLLFTVKHREIDGSLTCNAAEDIRKYARGLLDD